MKLSDIPRVKAGFVKEAAIQFKALAAELNKTAKTGHTVSGRDIERLIMAGVNPETALKRGQNGGKQHERRDSPRRRGDDQHDHKRLRQRYRQYRPCRESA